MNTSRLSARVAAIEAGIRRRPSPEGMRRQGLLRRLSFDELEALQGAIAALDVGEPLTDAQEAAIAAWERLVETDDRGRICAG